MAIPLKNLLRDAVNRAGIAKGVLASNVVKEFNSVCRELYGEKTCDMIEHVSYRNKALTIKCREAVVAQNLRFNKMRLINEVNQSLKVKAVENIQIVIV
jgi:hypothetical protein